VGAVRRGEISRHRSVRLVPTAGLRHSAARLFEEERDASRTAPMTDVAYPRSIDRTPLARIGQSADLAPAGHEQFSGVGVSQRESAREPRTVNWLVVTRAFGHGLTDTVRKAVSL
jgi:hypothetical protein